MTVGDRVRIVGTSAFHSRVGTIIEVFEDDPWFRYKVAIEDYRGGIPISFMESEVVLSEET